jgi:hypothetical protein
MSEQEFRSGLQQGLSDGPLELVRLGRVDTGPGTEEPYVLLDVGGQVVDEVGSWIKYLASADHSPRTMRSYCYACLTCFRVLWMPDIPWDRATVAETAAMVGWLRNAPNPQRRAGLAGAAVSARR